jgi:hypothetical protein
MLGRATPGWQCRLFELAAVQAALRLHLGSAVIKQVCSSWVTEPFLRQRRLASRSTGLLSIIALLCSE